MKENQVRRLQGILSLADVVGRAEVKTSQTHETLKQVSAPTHEPSKPRAQSRGAA